MIMGRTDLREVVGGSEYDKNTLHETLKNKKWVNEETYKMRGRHCICIA